MKINLFKTLCYISIFLLNGFELSAQMFNVKINNNLHTENFDGRLLLLFPITMQQSQDSKLVTHLVPKLF